MSHFIFETRQDVDGFWRCQILHTPMGFFYGEAVAADEAMSLERAKAMARGLELAYANAAEFAIGDSSKATPAEPGVGS